MKNIKKIICIALLAIFAVACTDENIENSAIEKKSTQIEYLKEDSRDHTYEIDYNDKEILIVIQRIDSLMNGSNISLNEYTIEEALFAMELYFNYAVVDKQINCDTLGYEAKIFTFSLERNRSGKIDVQSLKEKYTLFLNNVISSINNKYILYSDLYVHEINDNNIKFGLYIPPMKNYINRNQIIKNNTDPIYQVNDYKWDVDVIPITYDINELAANYDFFRGADQTIRGLSRKYANRCLFSNINTCVPDVQNLRLGYKVYTEPTGLITRIFSANQVENLLVRPLIVKLNSIIYPEPSRVAIDVNPIVWREFRPGTSGYKYPLADWYLSIASYQSARKTDINIEANRDLRVVIDRLHFPL